MTDPKKPFLRNKNNIEGKIEHDIAFFDYNYHRTNKFMIMMKRQLKKNRQKMEKKKDKEIKRDNEYARVPTVGSHEAR